MTRYLGIPIAYDAWFQCMNGCPGAFDLREIIYWCPTCGDLLEVQQDMEALKSRSAAAWIQLFDERYRRNMYPYGSACGARMAAALHRQDRQHQRPPAAGTPLVVPAPMT
jgi:hypothetical protein